MTFKARVTIIESEAGWGQRVDDVLYFDSEQEAKDFVKKYNDQHNPPGPVPSWYMTAMYSGVVSV